MADITISVPAGVTTRVLDAIAARNGYNAAVDGTKAAFAKKWLIQMVKNEVKGYEGSTAGHTAQQAAVDAVETGITIT